MNDINTGSVEVSGSIPLGSTKNPLYINALRAHSGRLHPLVKNSQRSRNVIGGAVPSKKPE